ncbi:MAG TPA: hypothetical protein VGD38_07065 [Pyrinomonadaceae bacterium]
MLDATTGTPKGTRAATPKAFRIYAKHEGNNAEGVSEFQPRVGTTLGLIPTPASNAESVGECLPKILPTLSALDVL